MNPYETLGIDEKASIEEISNVFRVLAKKYHPDTSSSEEERIAKESKFTLITQAYNTLKNKTQNTEKENHDDEEKNYNRAAINKAKKLIALKEYDSAIRILKGIEGKLYYDAVMLLGETYLRKAKYHESLKYFRIVYEKKPWNINVKLKIAYIYEKIGLKKTAKKMYVEVLSMDSANSKALEKLSALNQKKFTFSNLFKKG